MSDDNIIEFSLVAITRDLSRRPEIRHLAKVLARLGPNNHTDDIAPIYLFQAYRLIEKPELVQLLLDTIEICKKDR